MYKEGGIKPINCGVRDNMSWLKIEKTSWRQVDNLIFQKLVSILHKRSTHKHFVLEEFEDSKTGNQKP